jgi:hypothetical protein
MEPAADRKDRKRVQQRRNVLNHLLVNEEHKVLFCFIPKISCTNMKKIFLVMNGFYPSVEKVNECRVHLRGLRIRLSDEKFTEKKREYMLKNFYKFMIVRDPFERLVSGYRSKFQDKDYVEFWAPLGEKIIKKYRYNNTNTNKTVITGLDVSFTEYVRYLIDNPPWEIDDHWMRYEDLCHPCNVKYDFIGSIDNLDRDVTHAMRQIHANETKYHVIHNSDARTKTKQTTADFLKELSREYFDQLLAAYKTDHELFGYPLPKYETLDKRYPA